MGRFDIVRDAYDSVFMLRQARTGLIAKVIFSDESRFCLGGDDQ